MLDIDKLSLFYDYEDVEKTLPEILKTEIPHDKYYEESVQGSINYYLKLHDGVVQGYTYNDSLYQAKTCIDDVLFKYMKLLDCSLKMDLRNKPYKHSIDYRIEDKNVYKNIHEFKILYDIKITKKKSKSKRRTLTVDATDLLPFRLNIDGDGDCSGGYNLWCDFNEILYHVGDEIEDIEHVKFTEISFKEKKDGKLYLKLRWEYVYEE